MSETWRPIPSAPDYDASDAGRVRSRRRREPMVLRPIMQGNGYYGVNIPRANRRASLRGIHLLVMEAFVGPRPLGLVVRHLDGDQANNTLSNLAYGTASENARDRVRHGRDHNARKTHCPTGHAYDDANTHLRRTNQRACRTCDREAQRRRRATA